MNTETLTHKYTSVHYRVAIDGGTSWLGQEGYSEYHNRWSRMHNGTLAENEKVYGLEQAQAHIKEYLEKKDEYTEKRKQETLTIEKVTTIVEIVQ